MKLDAKTVEGFAGSVLAQSYDAPTPTPECHREWWRLCCSDDKHVAIAAPRGHAKSTAITFTYLLAALLFREHDFALIVSDTEGQAVLFLNDLKKEVAENEHIIELFGVEKIEKDAETDVIIRFKDGHRFRVMAKGSEQKVRGIKWRGKRPNLIIGDDLENDEIVMNPQRREKFRRWMNAALIPCLSVDGKIRIVGTILHIDSFLENRMPKLFAKRTVTTPLFDYSENKIGAWRSVKYRAHDQSFQNILWPQRYDKEWLIAKRADLTSQGLADLYNQEFLNYPIDESRAIFRRADLLPMDEEKYLAIITKKIPVRFFVGTDLAVSSKSWADYSVFIVGAIDAQGIIYIIRIIRDRLDTLELVETFLQLQQQYEPDWFAVEKGTILKSIGPFLDEESFKRSIYPDLVLITPDTDKVTRAKSIAGRVRINRVLFYKDEEWYPQFEEEITQFPRGQKDDQADAFSTIGLALAQLVTAPTEEEQEQTEYEEEKARSGSFNDGRSQLTGY